MRQNPNYYKDCQFYIGNRNYGGQALRYDTEVLAGKFCVPTTEALSEDMIKQFKAEFDKYFLDSGFAQYFSDIAATSDLLAYTIGTAFLIGFLYMVVLYFLGGFLIWISIVLIIGANLYGGYMLYQTSEVMDETDKYK